MYCTRKRKKTRRAFCFFVFARDQGLLDRRVPENRERRPTANGFGSRSTLAIAEPRFAILGLNFWLFFSPMSRRLRSRAPTSVTPAYGSYATPLSSACIPRVSRARARRALWIFFAAVAVAATPRGAVETTLREKINISGSKPKRSDLPPSRRNLPTMAAMTSAAAMPATRAQFAPKRASRARVVRRGVVASAGKRGTSLTLPGELSSCFFYASGSVRRDRHRRRLRRGEAGSAA